ncbi:MAG: DUF427 domain-containing protein [Kiloniellaceae bacterium]
MTQKTHSASVSMAGEPYVAKVGAVTIARSDRAMILEEVNGSKTYPPVIYFPQDDIEREFLAPSERSSHCPIKGDAGYFNVQVDGTLLEDAAWFYPEPLPMVRAVKGYVAFYPDKVTVAKA